jgi:hypothetical protein
MLLLGGNCDSSVGELSSSGGLWHGGEGPETLDNFGFRVAFVPNAEVPEPVYSDNYFSGLTTIRIPG